MPDFDALFSKISKDVKNDPACAVKKAGDITLSSRIPYGIPSGIPELELAIGRTGIPAGRLTEFYGFEKSGKTTAAYHVLAQAQRMGGGGMFIDSESTWDEERATQLGIDPHTNFFLGEVQNIEGIFRLMLSTLDNLKEVGLDKPFVFVIDSITGVESEINDDAKKFGKEARVGQDARLIRRGCRLVNKKIAETKAAAIFINHAISTINSMPFGPDSTAAGGRALKLFSTLRVQFRAGKDLQDKKPKDDDELRMRHGMTSWLKVEKLKGSKLMFQSFSIDLLDDGGFDTTTSLLRAGVHTDWIQRKNDKTLVMFDHEFAEDDWPAMVESLGGRQVAYKAWMDWCLENGKLHPWNNFGAV